MSEQTKSANDSGIDPRVLAGEIAEDAKTRVDEWLKRTFWGVGVCATIVVAIALFFGFKSFADLDAKVKAEVDARVSNAIAERTELTKDTTGTLIRVLAEQSAASHAHLAETEVQLKMMEERLAAANRSIDEFQGRLAQYESEADKSITTFKLDVAQQLSSVGPGSSNLGRDWDSFLAASQGYADRIGLKTPAPPFKVDLSPGNQPGNWASWDASSKTYHVNPARIGTTGFAEHAAIMSRLFQASHHKFFGPDVQAADTLLYDDIRNSIPAFLLSAEGIDFELYRGKKLRVLIALQRLATATESTDAVRLLAISISEQLEPDWTFENLSQKVANLNDETSGLTDEAIADAFANISQ